MLPTNLASGGAQKRRSSATLEGLKNSAASALATGCSKTLLAPLDTLKTIQQHHRSTGESLSLWQATQLAMSRPKGLMELYAGVGVAVIGSMPSAAIYFGVYAYCKRVLQPFYEKHLPDSIPPSWIFTLTVASAAAVGNTVASFSRVPYEVVKQKLQTGLYSSTWQALSTMFRQEGLRAFFPMGGISIQMMRDIPYAIVTLWSYETLKRTVQPAMKERYPDTLVDAVTGAVSGGLGSYVTNPLDVLKTRIQTNPDVYGGSIPQCFFATWKEGGPMAFLRGSVPRLLHKVPANGVFFLFYEFFRTVLQVEDTVVTDANKNASRKK